MQGLEAHKYRSTVHCVTELMKKEGPMAFYKGVGPRLTRVCLEGKEAFILLRRKIPL